MTPHHVLVCSTFRLMFRRLAAHSGWIYNLVIRFKKKYVLLALLVVVVVAVNRQFAALAGRIAVLEAGGSCSVLPPGLT